MSRYSNEGRAGFPWAAALGAAVALLVIAAFVFGRVVDEGERCAIRTLGRVTGVADSGFHLRVPLVVSFKCFSTREVVYETSDDPVSAKSDADYKDFSVPGQTKDGQQISVNYSIRYHVDPGHIQEIYSDVASNMRQVNERVIKFHSRSIVRLTMQEYNALDLYTGNIIGVQTAIEKEMQAKAGPQWTVVDAFVIRKINFDPDYVEAVENKQIAFETIQTRKYEVEQAQNVAQSAIETAKGAAEAQIIQAQAEAKSIELRGRALVQNPLVIQYEFVQNMDFAWGILPTGQGTIIQIPEFR